MQRLTITQTDIDKATEAQHTAASSAKYTCPISQAIKRRFPLYASVSVQGAIRYVPPSSRGVHRYRIDFTEAIKKFIDTFDNKRPVTPTTFYLPKAIKEYCPGDCSDNPRRT